MKQLIVFIALTILGIAMYNMLMGPQETSLYSTMKKLWTHEVENQQKYP